MRRLGRLDQRTQCLSRLHNQPDALWQYDLVTRQQRRLQARLAIDQQRLATGQHLQIDRSRLRLDTHEQGRQRFVFQHDIGLGTAAHHPVAVQCKRTPVQMTAVTTQQCRCAGVRRGIGMAAKDMDILAIDIDLVATAHNGHASHRATIDMHLCTIMADLQPQTAAIQAEPRQQQHAHRADPGQNLPGGMPHHRTQAIAQGHVGSRTVGEMKTEHGCRQRIRCMQSITGVLLAISQFAAKITATNSDWLIPSMIDISHPHRLDATAARAVVQTIADKLAERFEMGNCWEGEALVFSRAGVEGRISLLPGQVRVTAQLGFPYSMMQSMVEEEIQRVLAQRLG